MSRTKKSLRGGRRNTWTPPPTDMELPPGPPRPRKGHPFLPDEITEKVRMMLYRGDTARMIVEAVGVGASVITRIRREIEAKERERQGAVKEKIVAAMMRGGMSRASAVNLLNQL